MARVLSFLLLSSIAFSATFGVVHTHGSRSNEPGAGASESAGFVRAGDLAGGQTGGPLNAGDYGPVFTPAPPAEHAAAALVTVPYLSTNSTPRRGRAPPQTSL